MAPLGVTNRYRHIVIRTVALVGLAGLLVWFFVIAPIGNKPRGWVLSLIVEGYERNDLLECGRRGVESVKSLVKVGVTYQPHPELIYFKTGVKNVDTIYGNVYRYRGNRVRVYFAGPGDEPVGTSKSEIEEMLIELSEAIRLACDARTIVKDMM